MFSFSQQLNQHKILQVYGEGGSEPCSEKFKCQELWQMYRALLRVYTALLRICKALLRVYRAVWRDYRSLFLADVQGSLTVLFCGCIGLFCECIGCCGRCTGILVIPSLSMLVCCSGLQCVAVCCSVV